MNQIGIAVIAAFISGFLQPVQATVNGKAAAAGLGTGWAASFSALTTGIVLAIFATLFSQSSFPRADILSANSPIALLGGLFGVVILGGMTYATPVLGTVQTFLIFFSAIAISSLLIDLTGILGGASSQFTLPQIGGALMIVIGIVVLRTA